MPTDNAGNTLGTARDISLNSAMSFTDRVDALDPNDYYRFTLTSRSSVNLTLANLSANADLQLLNSSGTVLQASQNSNAMTDLIIATLDPGTYYVQVLPGSGSAGTDYSLSTSAYTGSRQLELFWRDASGGANGLWHMGGTNNTTIASLSALNAVATNWQIDAIADFNQDGIPDLVWRDYASGSNGIWFMGGSNNDTILSTTSLAAMSTNWRLEGVADFNGDNRPDLIWRDYTQGYNQIWLMGGTNNTVIASTIGLSQVSTNWGIDAVADINGDNRPDLVWREYTQGAVGIWFMGGTNNTTIASTAALNPIPVNWHLEGVADFNQDNRPDFVWRDYTSGNNGIWLMGGTNNTAITSTIALSPVAGNWRMTPFTRVNQPALIDGAGNSTTMALNIGSLSGNASFRETVNRSDGDDYYRFNIDVTSNFNLTLNEQNVVNADANVQLWDTFGNVIQQSFSGTSTESISRTLNSGTYYIRVYQSASETTNYTLNLSTTASIASPDLRGSFFDATPEPLNTGSSFTINFRVQNAGSSSAGTFRVGFYLSSDSTITTSDRQLGFYDITALAANTVTSTLSTTLALPGMTDSFWSGSRTYYIGMIVDSLNGISESNESNNANLGNGTDWDDVAITIPSIVTIAANDANASEVASGQPANPGQFTFSRTGDTSTALTVYYTIAGSATNGSDYNSISNSIIFQAGQSTATLPINIINDLLAEGNETVVITLNSSSSYTLGSSTTGTVTIANYVPPVTADPGNTLSTAEVQSSAVFTRAEQVSSADQNDFYRFTISTSGIFTATLSGLTGDADVRLIRDQDNDATIDPARLYNSTTGALDQGEILAWQWERGTTGESIRHFLSAGTYYLQVMSYNNQMANYTVATGFTAAASDDRQFSIAATYGSTINATARATIQKGINFWLNAIPYTSFATAQTFSLNIYEDITITGSTLAQGGYSSTQFDPNHRLLPTAGFLELSTSYLSTLNSDATYTPDTIIHEIGHALGLVGLLNHAALINDTTSTYNASTYAGWAYGELKGTYTQTAIPLTSGVGSGSDLNHWKEEVFGNETMTHVTQGATGSLSQLSLAAMRDMGWNINFGAAQPYALPVGGTGTTITTTSNWGNLGQGWSGWSSYAVDSEFTDRMYRFTLNQLSTVNLTLSGLSADANMRLIYDSNNNGIIDAGEVISSAITGGTASESITRSNLAAGVYYVDIYAGNTIDVYGNRLINQTGYTVNYAVS